MPADPEHPAAARAGFSVVQDDMHPFGDPTRVTVHEGSQVPEAPRRGIVIALDPRTVLSILLVVIGALSVSVAAFMVSVALGLAVAGVLCLVVGILLGFEPRPGSSSEEG